MFDQLDRLHQLDDWWMKREQWMLFVFTVVMLLPLYPI